MQVRRAQVRKHAWLYLGLPAPPGLRTRARRPVQPGGVRARRQACGLLVAVDP